MNAPFYFQVCCVLVGALFSYTVSSEPLRVWVDTDLACGTASSVDIDDCLALAYLLTSQRFHVDGISTVHGNANLVEVTRSMDRFREVFARSYPDQVFPPVYQGAAHALPRFHLPEPVSAVTSLQEYLNESQNSVVIVALGPLTNMAQLALHFPDAFNRIGKILWVAGTRSESRRFFPGNTRLFSVRDFNLVKDKRAANVIFQTDVLMQLAGYELGSSAIYQIRHVNDLGFESPLNKHLELVAGKWQAHWRQVYGINGFHPFDLMAVMSLEPQTSIECGPFTAILKRRFATVHSLRVGAATDNAALGRPVLYCVQPRQMR